MDETGAVVISETLVMSLPLARVDWPLGVPGVFPVGRLNWAIGRCLDRLCSPDVGGATS